MRAHTEAELWCLASHYLLTNSILAEGQEAIRAGKEWAQMSTLERGVLSTRGKDGAKGS